MLRQTFSVTRRRRAALLACLTLGAVACDARPPETGEQLAQRYCQSCHVLPSPALLDRASWERWVLPRMARRLGLGVVGDSTSVERTEPGVAGKLVHDARVFPDSAAMTRDEWRRLAEYYLRAAPASLGRPAVPVVPDSLPGFRVRESAFRIPTPTITLVHIDSARSRVYVGDAATGTPSLNVIDGRSGAAPGRPFLLPSPVSHLTIAGDTLKLVFMGKLHPSDAPRGALAEITAWTPGAAPTIAWEVDGMQRPVYASYADLNGDGLEDVVVSEFGYLTGRLAWYERLPNGSSTRHVLLPAPGALTTIVRDVDGDGRPDVLALVAQGDESVWLFRNRPNGEMAAERLLRFPPSYGSIAMALADVNGDGADDLVITSGDAGDYPAPPKPYQGVRVFLNDGRWHFTEKYFFPMPGAFQVVARDFDGDGDVDLAAIAFYPDYTSPAPLSFVYLENRGGMTFAPHTFADANRGRWLAMDAGDVNGDGRPDIVLGSFALMDALGGPPGQTSARWRQPGAPTILILENTRGRAR